MLDQRRFAGTGMTDNADKLSVRYLQADLIKCFFFERIAFSYITVRKRKEFL